MRPGTGAYPLRGHNNVQGASDSAPCRILSPGYQKVEDPEVIARNLKQGWKVKMPTTKGLDNHEMIDAIHQGKLKAMYMNGEDTITSDANENDVREALAKLEIFRGAGYVLQRDLRATPTSFCPPAPALKKREHSPIRSGAFSGSIKCSSRLAKASPDWRIIQDIANAARRELELQPSFRNHGRGRLV